MPEVKLIATDQINIPDSLVRTEISQEGLEQLTQSIAQVGILHPLILTQRGEKFLLVIGLRRLLAAQSLNMPTVPSIILELSDEDIPLMALNENLFREDVSPVDEAYALQALEERFHLTRDKIAKMIGKSKAYVTQRLDIVTWDSFLITATRKGDVSFSQGRALSKIDNIDRLKYFIQTIIDSGASVRVVEAWVQEYLTEKSERLKASSTIQPLRPAVSQDKYVPLTCHTCGSGPRDDLYAISVCPDCLQALTMDDEKKK